MQGETANVTQLSFYRLHDVKFCLTFAFSTSRIITLAPGDPEPFRAAALMPEDAFAVITVEQMAFFTGRANIITALN